MKSLLVMKDLVEAKKLSAAEMSAVSGGRNSEGRFYIQPFPFHGGDDYCGTPVPPIKGCPPVPPPPCGIPLKVQMPGMVYAN